jgi:hypothetical protein
MNKIANVTFSTTMVDLPAGMIAGGYQSTMFRDGAVYGSPVNTATETDPVQFIITDTGTFRVEVARVSTSGEVLAAPATSDSFLVVADQIAVPLVVTVNVVDAALVPTLVNVVTP